ncbi:hypothetical protein SAMN05444166_4757 [Singulisphaera sp. GP187]|nr:hypothetical protein SAMN05444166_4757 [Singulisphaera sp. GP187]
MEGWLFYGDSTMGIAPMIFCVAMIWCQASESDVKLGRS